MEILLSKMRRDKLKRELEESRAANKLLREANQNLIDDIQRCANFRIELERELEDLKEQLSWKSVDTIDRYEAEIKIYLATIKQLLARLGS